LRKEKIKMRLATSLLTAAGLVGSLACSTQGIQTSSAASVTNTDLKQMVQFRLATDPQLAPVDVSADANLNQVTLSGTLSTEEARTEAVDRAKTARANLVVIDKIDVKPAIVSRSEYNDQMARDTREKAKQLGDKISQSLDDTWTYSKIEAKLAGQSANSAFKIHVDVDHHEVTLRGEVSSLAAKDDAERIARETEGVTRVNNLLRVRA
jgi:osmotically-inducible protein OsmY